MKRKSTTTLKVGGKKAVNVEVRKKRTYVKRDPIEDVAEEEDAEAEAQLTGRAAPADEPVIEYEPVADTIDINTFAQIDLRIAEVVAAEHVQGADKLLQLDLNLGFEQRTVFAGIKSAYDPATLVGRQVVVVANLAARKMRFGTSQGMVLAAGPGGEEIWLLSPDSGAVPGMRVR